MYPIRIFWHENITEYHLEITKTRKTQQKNELLMHTKINISTVFIKFVLKMQGLKIIKAVGRTHARTRLQRQQSDLEHHQDPTVE